MDVRRPVACSDPWAELLEFALRRRLTTRTESHGKCLHATVLLARHGRALGLADDLQFLHWRVKDDLDFREHWAMSWRDGYALDMAAAQIDGDPTPVRPIAGYPSNYVDLRRYHAGPILSCFDTLVEDESGRYKHKQILTLHRLLMRMDMRRALASRSVLGLLGAITRFCQAATLLALGYLLEKALKRLSRVLLRLN